MPDITPIVTAISNEVVTQLAAGGYPVLTPLQDGSAGKILLGRHRQFEQSAPPRIIFVPTRSTFTAKDVYNRSNVSTFVPYSAEGLVQNAHRSVMTDMTTFEVRCWGTHDPPDPELDFDLTRALYQSVLIAAHLLAVGTYTVEGGTWTDATFSSGQLFRDGREFVFSLTLGTPVLDKLLPFAPNDVTADTTDRLQLPNGSSEIGC